MLEFARWKYILVALVMVLALIFAAPNFFGEDLAVQVARRDRAAIDAAASKAIETASRPAGCHRQARLCRQRPRPCCCSTSVHRAAGGAATPSTKVLSATYVSALSRAPRAPAIFRKLDLRPMPLGLDLRGGLYLLYQVDVNGAVKQLARQLRAGLPARADRCEHPVHRRQRRSSDDGRRQRRARDASRAGTNLDAARDVMQQGGARRAPIAINEGGPCPTSMPRSPRRRSPSASATPSSRT